MKQNEKRIEEIRDEDDRLSERPAHGNGHTDDRGLLNKATDEVRSWVGDSNARRRRRLDRIDYWHARQRFAEVRAGDVMTCDVTTVYPSDPVKLAARLMRKCDCGALPVVERHNQLVGMITDRDITIRLVARGIDTNSALVRDCMTNETFKCHTDDSIYKCLDIFSRHQVRRVPVVDDRDRVVGVISQCDIALLAGASPGRGERRAIASVLSAISEPSHAAYR